MLQERGTLSRPKSGLLSNTWKWIFWGDTGTDKLRHLIRKGTRVESTRVRQTGRTALPHGSQSRVYGDGISFQVVFRQSFWSESFLVVHASLSQDGGQWEGFWEMVGHVVSPFDLSQTLLVGGALLVPCSLPEPPVVKQLKQIVTMVPGQGRWFQSVNFP